MLVLQDRERTERHLIGEADDGSIGSLRVELKHVRMQVRLAGEPLPRIIFQLALIDDVNTVLHVSTNNQRKLLRSILSDLSFLFMQDIEQAARIDDRRRLGRRRLQGNRQGDCVDVEFLDRRSFRTETPWPLLSRPRRLGRVAAVITPVDRFQPGRAAVARREWHPSAEMRPQPWPREFSTPRIEENLLPLARRRRLVVHPFVRRFRLGESLGSVPSPFVDGRVIGQGLFLFRVLMSWLTLRRHLHLNPILDGYLDRIGFPIRLILGDLEFLAAVPIDHRPHELIARYAALHTTDTVRQFDQRFHHICLKPRRLQRVVHSPESPHPRDIVLRDVAVEHELSG